MASSIAGLASITNWVWRSSSRARSAMRSTMRTPRSAASSATVRPTKASLRGVRGLRHRDAVPARRRLALDRLALDGVAEGRVTERVEPFGVGHRADAPPRREDVERDRAAIEGEVAVEPAGRGLGVDRLALLLEAGDDVEDLLRAGERREDVPGQHRPSGALGERPADLADPGRPVGDVDASVGLDDALGPPRRAPRTAPGSRRPRPTGWGSGRRPPPRGACSARSRSRWRRPGCWPARPPASVAPRRSSPPARATRRPSPRSAPRCGRRGWRS